MSVCVDNRMTHLRRYWTYKDLVGGYTYVAQVANGGIANPVTINGQTCNFPTGGYGVRPV
jgi:hypothetical protein